MPEESGFYIFMWEDLCHQKMHKCPYIVVLRHKFTYFIASSIFGRIPREIPIANDKLNRSTNGQITLIPGKCYNLENSVSVQKRREKDGLQTFV